MTDRDNENDSFFNVNTRRQRQIVNNKNDNYPIKQGGSAGKKFEHISILELRARNNTSPTLPISLSRIQVTMIIFFKIPKKTNPPDYNWKRTCNKKKSTQNLAANKQQSKLEIILYLNCL